MNMKRFLAIISALAILLSLFACGGKESTDSDTPSDGTNESDEGSDTPAESDSSSSDYLTYEDLPRTESFTIWSEENRPSIKIDYPDFRFDSHGNGMGSEDSFHYSIVTVNGENRLPDSTLDDAFMTLLNGEDGFHAILRMVYHADYSELEPETETITLPCGREAIKFSGTQHVDNYGTLYDSPIYGYCTLCNDIPVIVCCILLHPDEVSNSKALELQNYVDEMINTVRYVEE